MRISPMLTLVIAAVTVPVVRKVLAVTYRSMGPWLYQKPSKYRRNQRDCKNE